MDGTVGVVYKGRLAVDRIVPEVARRAQSLMSAHKSGGQLMAPGPAGSAQVLRTTELMLRILMRGVIDTDSACTLSVEAGLGAGALDTLIAGGALVDDEGLLYVTEAGDRRLTEELHAQLAPGEESSLAAFAEKFDVLDQEVKSAVTAWQQATRAEDQEGQVKAVERWLDADSRLREVTARAQSAARLFQTCFARLESARQRVLDGDPDQLSGIAYTSYHSVWFLLYEILLRTLKRNAKDEHRGDHCSG